MKVRSRRRKLPPAAAALLKEKAKRWENHLEGQLVRYGYRLLPETRAAEAGPSDCVREFRWCPGRLWRADFAFPNPSTRLLVEVQGGSWSGGRHTRGAGYEQDCEKLVLAQLAGWTMFWFTPRQVKDWTAAANIEQFLVEKLGLAKSDPKVFIPDLPVSP
jgi:hypothetical protein